MNSIDVLRRAFTANLLQTGRHWRRLVDQALIPHNISEACGAPLVWIGRLGGGVRQNNLATYVGIEGPSLVRLLDQLEAGDFVIRKADKVDRRAKTLWLTKKGEQTAAMLEDILVGLRGEILADVSEEDLKAALRVLSAFDRAGHLAISSVGEIEPTP